MTSGVALIFVFPFDLLVVDEDPDPVGAVLSDARGLFYWPFWSTNSGTRQLTSVPLEAVPFPPGLQKGGRQGLVMVASPGPGPGLRFADALRVDLHPVPPDLATAPSNTLGERLVASLLSHVRFTTGQWWIGHSHQEFQFQLRNWFLIDSSGEIANPPAISLPARIEPRLGFELPLTPEMFAAGVNRAVAGDSVGLHWDMFFDAVFFWIGRESIARAVVDSVTSLELAIDHAVFRLAAVRGQPFDALRRGVAETDLLGKLQRGVPRLFSRRYDQEHPALFQSIRALWAVRGSIAHGLLTSTGARAGVPSQSEIKEMLDSVRHLLMWLDELSGH